MYVKIRALEQTRLMVHTFWSELRERAIDLRVIDIFKLAEEGSPLPDDELQQIIYADGSSYTRADDFQQDETVFKEKLCELIGMLTATLLATDDAESLDLADGGLMMTQMMEQCTTHARHPKIVGSGVR